MIHCSTPWKFGSIQPSNLLGREVDISIILATRKRQQLFNDLINSIINTASDLSRIECLVAHDEDDERPAASCPWLYYFPRGRGNNLSRDYHNWLFRYSVGDVLFVLNDDCLFATHKWDDIARLKLNTSLPQYGQTNPTLPYSEFPLVTRKMVESLGYLMPDHFGGWGADNYLYREASIRGWVVPIPEIEIKHLRTQDETHNNMGKISGNHHMVI